MKRLFAAVVVHPTPGFLKIYSQLKEDLSHERIKWVETKNIHITLRFFGETEEKRIPGIQDALQTAAETSESFTMKIHRTGIFGSRYDPKVVWFGIDPDERLSRLAENTVRELQKAGWEPDRQNFVPHLTIGRIREIRDKSLFQEIIAEYRESFIQEQSIKEVILYESILKREGPDYLKLAVFPLKS